MRPPPRQRRSLLLPPQGTPRNSKHSPMLITNLCPVPTCIFTLVRFLCATRQPQLAHRPPHVDPTRTLLPLLSQPLHGRPPAQLSQLPRHLLLDVHVPVRVRQKLAVVFLDCPYPPAHSVVSPAQAKAGEGQLGDGSPACKWSIKSSLSTRCWLISNKVLTRLVALRVSSDRRERISVESVSTSISAEARWAIAWAVQSPGAGAAMADCLNPRIECREVIGKPSNRNGAKRTDVPLR